jgi:hypothetical protein
MANWLDKYEQGGLVLKKKTKDNYGKKANPNDVQASVGPDFVGLGYNIKGRNYSPAWGGQFQMGGALPGSVGFMYARTQDPAPANGKYTKKTKASAQNGQEMKYYQEGLDFKPKTISKNGSAIKDDRGQWAYPGEITEIGSNDITMQGVDYPVLGISDKGDTQMMYPDQDYKFDGKKVTEFPMAQDGKWLNKYQDGGDINKKLKKEAEETIARRNANRPTMSQYTPKPGEQAKFDKQKLQRIADENKPLNKFARSKASGNLQDAIEAAMVMEGGLAASKLAGKLVAKGLPKATRAGLNAIDRNFSNVGKELVQIEKEGLKKGLSPYEIKKLQMEKVGITSSQREAYVPGVSDFLSEYVTPFGYSGMVDGKPVNKLKETLLNIKRGGKQTLSQSHPTYGVLDQQMFPREDAWNLYLGKPQRSNTFRIANTSPVNHPSYTPNQLSNMDIYSLNKMSNTLGITPRRINTIEDPVTYYAQDFVSSEANQVTKNPIKHNIELLENDIVLDRNVPVMGGYNKRLSGTGLDYNDIWDLEPTVTNPITKKPIKVKVDKFIGKPFMSHGVFPDVNKKEVLDNLNDIVDVELKNSLANKKRMLDGTRFEKGKLPLRNSPIPDENEFMEIDNFVRATKDVENLTKIKDRLKNIPKKEKGGWLNKYK